MSKSMLCVLITLLSGPEVMAGDHDSLALSLDQQEEAKWEVGYSKRSGDVSITELVPKGESVKNWTKLLTIQGFRKSWGSPSVQALAEEFKNALAKKCPNVVWNVIENQKNAIAYEWSIQNCAAAEDQHEIAKYIQGKWSQFRVAYAQKTSQLDQEDRDKWLKIICDATVVIEKDK